MKIKRLGIVLIVNMALLTGSPACWADGPYHFIKEIPLPGVAGCRAMTVDESGKQLFLVNADQVKVVDLLTDRVVTTVTNTAIIQGFAVEGRTGHAFLTDGQEAKLKVVDLHNRLTTMKFKTVKDPGVVLYDHTLVYVFSQSENTVSVYEADDGDFLKAIPLTGKPNLAAVDYKAGKIFCLIEDKHEIDVIDSKKYTVIGHWPISPSEGVGSMAVDSVNRRLYLGCTNKMLAAFDSTSGNLITAIPSEQSICSVGINNTLHNVITCDTSGTVSVAIQYTLNDLKTIQTFNTGVKVYSLAVDSKTDNIYLATGGKIIVYSSHTISK